MRGTMRVAAMAAVVLAGSPAAFGGQQPWRQNGNDGTDPAVNFVGTTDNQGLAIRTADEERVRVTETGNLGINTSTPSARLVIRNDSVGQRPLMSLISGDRTPFHVSSTGSVTIDPVGADFAFRVRGGSSLPNGDSPIPFQVTASGDATALYVTRSGNVGVGASGEGINDQLRVRGNENDGTSAAVRIVSGSSQSQQTMLLDGNEIDAVDAGLFINHNSTADVMLATGGGNVGVGTSSPDSKLAVRSGSHQLAIVDANNNDKTWTLTSHQSSNGIGFWENATQPRFLVTSGGRVGIGTANPNHELVVQGNDPAMQIRDDASDDSTNAARLELLERSGGNFDGGAFLWWNGQTDKLLIGTKRGGINTNLLVLDRATDSVGIGTQTPGSFRLAVNGRVRAKEVVVDTGWSDFVFDPSYSLRPLDRVEAFIGEHRRLPDIPSAADVVEHGVSVGEMDARLLQKIEELTLYVLDVHKRLRTLERENASLRAAGEAR